MFVGQSSASPKPRPERTFTPMELALVILIAGVLALAFAGRHGWVWALLDTRVPTSPA